MLNEAELIPYHAVQTLGTGGVLVLAPHPDDEVFGCAGAIMRHVAGGDPVTVIVLTDGAGFQGDDLERESYAAQRRQESRAAAAILGYDEPQFWEYRDRELVYGEPLVQRLRDAVLTAEARWLYAPSPYELHPDHRHLALAALETARRLGGALTLAFYEIGAPLPPNRLLDISDVWERKRQAIACFTSQLATQAYDRHVEALNRYRTYTLPHEVEAAEAYWVLEGGEVAGMTLDTIPGLLTVQHTAPVRENTEINALSCAEMDASPSDGISVPLVDVIIPVYRGLDETRRCLNSVLAFPQQTLHEIVVIDDCSPEPELSTWLRDLAETGAITLLVNPVNTGFVNTVNRGMVLHPERDVVLLNSDTEVNGDWLDRLRRCTYSDPQAGTVTPFSNNATICSYPRFMQDNPLPDGWPLAELDALFAEVNAGQAVDIPTAVGFCMYVTRRCLEQVGYFDATLFVRGYGEENDFSMRALEVGFRHLHAADVFIHHRGGVSFGAEATDLRAKAQHVLEQRHPRYSTLVGDYCARDPARLFRRRIDTARLARSPRSRLLFITHTWGGGTEKHIQELAEILESGFEVLILRPTGPAGVSVEWGRREEEFAVYFSLPYAYPKLLDFIRSLGIVRLHFHHIIGLNQQVLQLPRDLSLPYDFTLHDYYAVCPQYTLTLKDGRYCGEPDAEGCNACLAERPALWGLDILTWRALLGSLLIDADRVIVPSRDMLARMRNYVPDARYVCLPHPEPMLLAPVPSTQPSGELKILVLGWLTPAKGLHRLEACAIDARMRGLPLFFRVIGHSDWEVRQEPEIPLSFTGPYDDVQLPLLIGRERPDLIFFPAQWPETYSYTLSYALRTGLPIVAPRLGAFSERLAEYPQAWLLDWDTSAEYWNDFFVSYLNEQHQNTN